MGLSCKIHKISGNIVKVDAPNGNKSELYNNALKLVKNEDKALDIWATAYTTEFKKFYEGNSSGKFIFKTIQDKLKVLTNYNGIFSNKTGLTYYDDILHDNVNGKNGYFYFYKGVKADVVMMSPDEYLSKVRQGMNISKDFGINEGSKLSIKEGIHKGNKIDMPMLSYVDGKFNQEGRNRAVVAKEAGEKLIPVMVVESINYNDKVNTAKNIINDIVTNYDVKSRDDILNILESEYRAHRDMIFFIKDNVLDDININNTKIDTFPKELKLDNNGEPLLNDVLNFLDSLSKSKLTKSDIINISNSIIGTNINNLDELYSKLKSIFINSKGEFTIDKDKLISSNFYTKLEIDNILNNSDVRDKIKSAFDKIEYTISNYDDIDIKNSGNNNYGVVDIATTNDIGKFKIIDDSVIDKALRDTVGGVNNKELFDSSMHNFEFTSISHKYFNDAIFAKKIFDLYSNMKVIPSYTIVDGSLSRVNNTIFDEYKETLVAYVDNSELELNAHLLTTLSDEVWGSNPKEVKKVLNDITLNAIDFNIDIIGLANKYDTHSRNDILDFLSSLSEFTSKLEKNDINDNDILNFTDGIKQLFTVEEYLQNNIEKLEDNYKDKTLIKLYTDKYMTVEELYTKYNLLPTSLNNVYQKISKVNNIEELYTKLYDIVQNDDTILPNEAYYPTAYNYKGNFSKKLFEDSNNKNGIIKDIRRYFSKLLSTYNDVNINDNKNIEELIVYSKIFKNNIHNRINTINKYEFANNLYNFKGDYTYLSDQFISDFKNMQLKEKYKDSIIYKEVLSKFKVYKNGINYIGNNTTDPQIINSLYSNKLFDLKQYSLISKDVVFNNLFNKTLHDVTIESEANKFSNNIQLLQKFNGDYRVVGNNIVVKNSKDRFIRIKDKLYLKVRDEYNNSFYTNVPIHTNTNINKLSKIKYDKHNIDSVYSNNSDMHSVIEESILYSGNELKSINEKIDNCG